MCQFFVIVLMLVCAIVRIILSTCEDTTVWVAILSSTVDYILPSPKAINKIMSTKEQIFISLVGPGGSGNSDPIFDWLKVDTVQPVFDKIFYFYQHYQPLYSQMQREKLKFIQGVDFEMIEHFANNGTEYLLIFDYSCEKISNSKTFENCHCWKAQGSE